MNIKELDKNKGLYVYLPACDPLNMMRTVNNIEIFLKKNAKLCGVLKNSEDNIYDNYWCFNIYVLQVHNCRRFWKQSIHLEVRIAAYSFPGKAQFLFLCL